MDDKYITLRKDVFERCLDITEFMWNQNRHIPTVREIFNDAYEMYLGIKNGDVQQYIDVLQEEIPNFVDYYEKLEIYDYIDFIKEASKNIDKYKEK